MGRKKSNRPVRTRPLPSIPRIFDCPRCEATAIRISLDSDVALVECGNCLLKQTVTNIRQIEEPVDIYGNFLDEYYNNLELQEYPQTQEFANTEISTEKPAEEDTVESTFTQESEEISASVSSPEDDEEEEKPVQMGFVPRTKGDVLKKKHKEKDGKKKKFSLTSSSSD